MEQFFLDLAFHPVCKALQVDRLKIGSHGQIEIRGIQLPIDLLIKGLLNFVTYHLCSPFQTTGLPGPNRQI
jgi:hypothetical protein